MPKHHRLELPAIITVLVTIILLVWLDEAVDLPAMLFSAPPEPDGRWTESLIQSIEIAMLGGILVWYISRLRKRIDELENYIVVCAWCKRVRYKDERWVSIEYFLKHHRDISTSHGICPDCAHSIKPGENPAHLKDRQAR